MKGPRDRPRNAALHAGVLLLPICAAALAVVGCSREVEDVPEPYLPTSAHDAYGHGLRQAELSSTALGRAWLRAADRALETPLTVSPPFLESGYFDGAEAGAVGYLFDSHGGQRVEVEVEVDAREPARLFVDLFRSVDETGNAPVHVASAPEGSGRLEFEPRRDATYILRIQPELLRSLRYTVTIRVVAQLDFPVQGRDTGAIQSVFGAPRDAGRRRHHGVDIFAPRGTPILAAADAVVSRAGTTEIGGNVVWLRDLERGISIYYAHLDSSSVERGQRVRAGQPIGEVGNTGNARTTPPHLHFGVYARGPVDPWWWLAETDDTPRPVVADPDLIGTWGRATSDGLLLRRGPAGSAESFFEVESRTPVRVAGAAGSWYRVVLPDGASGYLTSRGIGPAAPPLGHAAPATPVRLLSSPHPDAITKSELTAPGSMPVLGAFNRYLWVRTPDGVTGWLRSE